jgi:phosphocarrier protein
MKKKTVTLTNGSGLHARPATLFVNAAQKFEADIFVEKDGTEINGKSILGILTLGAAQGSTITVIAKGTDEDKAVTELIELIESGFGE